MRPVSPSPRWWSMLAAVAVLAFALPVDAAPISKCSAAKKKCLGKYVAAVLGCHAKAETKGVVVDPACLAKAVAKITGGGKGCFDKHDAKSPNDCTTANDAAQHLTHADALILDVVTDVDPSHPAPTLTRCGAARKKCVGKKAAGLMGCSAKRNKDGIGDPACAPKIMDKFGGAKGCDVKALLKGPDCLGSTTTVTLESRVGAWAGLVEYVLDYVGPPCGNGLIDAGEFCDPAAPARPEAACRPDFACNPATCNCACPSTVHFLGDATSPNTVLDIGWTGVAHRTPIVTNGDVTVALSGCSGAERPCGVCTMNGPIPNAGASEMRNRRCTNDTSIRCTDDTPCLGGGGTCQYYVGTSLPLSAGGIVTCASNQFNGPIAGTVNLETGDAVTTALVTSHVYFGLEIDAPCPLCVGDASINDDVQGGTCSGGARDGLACDANGTVPSRPDFGATSLDCPSNPGALIASLPIDLSGATAAVARTLTSASPNCGPAAPGQKCLCHTCNTGAAEPCFSNADCPISGGAPGICGGNRCFGGPNAGAPCVGATSCPGGGLCSRAGEPPKPSVCFDDTTSPEAADCIDLDADGGGECLDGPVVTTCSAPHAQRVCTVDNDCTPGTCEAALRSCFPTGGGPTNQGTDTVLAVGVADVPVRDAAAPTLGSVFCIAPTGSASVNNVAGLPGPGRMTLHGVATGLP